LIPSPTVAMTTPALEKFTAFLFPDAAHGCGEGTRILDGLLHAWLLSGAGGSAFKASFFIDTTARSVREVHRQGTYVTKHASQGKCCKPPPSPVATVTLQTNDADLKCVCVR